MIPCGTCRRAVNSRHNDTYRDTSRSMCHGSFIDFFDFFLNFLEREKLSFKNKKREMSFFVHETCDINLKLVYCIPGNNMFRSRPHLITMRT